MDILYTTHNGKHLNTIVKYYIYLKTSRGIEISDKNTVLEKNIFDAFYIYGSVHRKSIL